MQTIITWIGLLCFSSGLSVNNRFLTKSKKNSDAYCRWHVDRKVNKSLFPSLSCHVIFFKFSDLRRWLPRHHQSSQSPPPSSLNHLSAPSSTKSPKPSQPLSPPVVPGPSSQNYQHSPNRTRSPPPPRASARTTPTSRWTTSQSRRLSSDSIWWLTPFSLAFLLCLLASWLFLV